MEDPKRFGGEKMSKIGREPDIAELYEEGELVECMVSSFGLVESGDYGPQYKAVLETPEEAELVVWMPNRYRKTNKLGRFIRAALGQTPDELDDGDLIGQTLQVKIEYSSGKNGLFAKAVDFFATETPKKGKSKGGS